MTEYEQDEREAYDALDAYHNQPRDVHCYYCGYPTMATERQLRKQNWYLGKALTLCPLHAFKATAIEAQPVPF